MRQTQTVKLVFSKRPYRDMRAEKRQRQAEKELRHNLAFVALFVIIITGYILIASQY